jgi:hypothetical protein
MVLLKSDIFPEVEAGAEIKAGHICEYGSIILPPQQRDREKERFLPAIKIEGLRDL